MKEEMSENTLGHKPDRNSGRVSERIPDGIKVISFDLDDTLWPVAEVITRAQSIYHDWFEQEYPELHAQGYLSVLAEKEALVRESPGGHCLTFVRKTSLVLTLLSAGVAQADAEAAAEKAFAVFHQERNRVTPFAGIKTFLRALKSDYKIVSLTNGNADVEKTDLRNLFHFNVNPKMLGVRKPDQKMFLAVCEKFSVEPHEVLHVGDHYEEDVLGAIAAGLNALWVVYESQKTQLWPARQVQLKKWLLQNKREPVAPIVGSVDSLKSYISPS